MQNLLTFDLKALDPLFQLFRDPRVAIWIASAIILFALVLLLWFVAARAAPTLLRLQRVNRQLRTVSREDFPSRFPEVDEAFIRTKMLRHSWSEFKETLVFPRPGEAMPIRNTARPATYLNVGTITAELHLPFYQAVPNYFVGFGLLFTFLGLVAALHFASQGVAGKTPAEAQAALQDLLSAATFKFATSIAGLVSSLLFSIVLKWLTIQLQIHFERLCNLLEARLVAVTLEGLIVDQKRELEKQTEQLERFNTDFAVEVASALESRLTGSLGNAIGQAIQPMVSAIDGMAKNFGDVNQDAMQKIVQDFQRSLQGAAGTEMQAIGGMLGRLSQTLEGAVAKMESSGGQFGSRLENAAKQLETLVTGAGNTLQAQVGDAASRLGTLMEEMSRSVQVGLAGATSHLREAAGGIGDQLQSAMRPITGEFDKISETLNNVDSKLRMQLGSFDASVAQLGGLARELGTLLDQIRKAGDPLSTVADRLQDVASHIDRTGAVIADAHSKLTDVAKTIQAGAEQVSGSWEKYRERFEGVDRDLERVFNNLQAGTMAYHQKLMEYVKEVDGHFTKAVNLFGGSIGELHETVQDLADAVRHTGRAAE